MEKVEKGRKEEKKKPRNGLVFIVQLKKTNIDVIRTLTHSPAEPELDGFSYRVFWEYTGRPVGDDLRPSIAWVSWSLSLQLFFLQVAPSFVFSFQAYLKNTESHVSRAIDQETQTIKN